VPNQSTYDCIIIGGGSAGLTCAIFLGRYRLRVLVVDGGRPRNYASRAIHGFLGYHEIAPGELLGRGRAEAKTVGAEVIDGTVSKRKMRTRRIVLAYGVRDTLPDIPDVDRYYGRAFSIVPIAMATKSPANASASSDRARKRPASP